MKFKKMSIKEINKKALWKEARDYAFITVAMMFYCVGWTIFLLPNAIATGGVPGVSSVLWWGFGIPVQWSYFAINAILMVFALRILGLKFCIKTIWAIIVLTTLIPISSSMTQGLGLLRDQPFMAAVLGAAFCGTGVGLGLSVGGSTGGTDIIAAIVNKYHDISLGRVILICDVIIISSSFLVLHSWEKVIYGYVVLYITAFCIDQVVNSMKQSVQFFIITDKYEAIGHRINLDPHRGCTVINAQGFYSGREVKMLFVLAKKRESARIFEIINEEDPTAFVSQSEVIGVYGEGFDRFKVRRHNLHSK
ncbi:MAG: YitT family protein [Prevotella sp.]|nr:YitT family protein [Prevotella sp.]